MMPQIWDFGSDEVRWCPCVSSGVAYTVAYMN
jgi:hypothetical protein